MMKVHVIGSGWVLKLPFDQFNNCFCFLGSVEPFVNYQTNVYSVNDRQWLLMSSISIVNLRGERNTVISLELIDFKLGVKRICFVIIVKSLRRIDCYRFRFS